jgi:hypothetical protein
VSGLKKHLSVANVLSVTALFIALGGSAYAAVKLRPNQVRSVNIAKEAVTQQKLKASAVTSGKIANGQVNNRDLANGSVSAGKIGGEAVTAKKLAKKAVTATALGPEAVTNAKLGNESVSQAKLAGSLYNQLVKNVTYVTETSVSNGSDNEKTITALCPVGKEVIGGGARINGATTKTVVNETAPALSVAGGHVGWYASGREVAEEVGNWSVSAFAICATL